MSDAVARRYTSKVNYKASDTPPDPVPDRQADVPPGDSGPRDLAADMQNRFAEASRRGHLTREFAQEAEFTQIDGRVPTSARDRAYFVDQVAVAIGSQRQGSLNWTKLPIKVRLPGDPPWTRSLS